MVVWAGGMQQSQPKPAAVIAVMPVYLVQNYNLKLTNIDKNFGQAHIAAEPKLRAQ